MFKGSMPALITPFDANGAFDEKVFREFVEWQIAEGSHGLVPVGTTGETPTLSVLCVTPYYNKPNQRGMKAHFSAIASAVNVPVFIYNIPGRSIVDMSVETMAELYSEHENIVGVKDATASMSRVSEQRHAMGNDFVQMSAEDISTLGFMSHGGHGCISVTANVAPRLCADFQQACLDGRYADALGFQDKLAPLHKALFAEPSPGGTKYALSLLGKCENIQRSPLVPIEASTEALVRDAMVHAGLIN